MDVKAAMRARKGRSMISWGFRVVPGSLSLRTEFNLSDGFRSVFKQMVSI